MRWKRPHPADRRALPFRKHDRPDHSRPRHAIHRPIASHPPPTAQWPECPAGRASDAARRALRKAQQPDTANETNRRINQRLMGLIAPRRFSQRSWDRRAAGSLRKSPSASPNAGPIGSGPDRTVARQRRATRLQPRASLKAAVAWPDARTGRNPFLRSRDHDRDPPPRTARLPAGASARTPCYRHPCPPVPRHVRRLDRLTSRPQPTPAAAIARLRIKGNR